MATAPADEFLDVDGLADLVKVPKHTIYQWRHKGTGPAAHRIGKHLRYRRSDVEAWLASLRDAS